MCVCVCEWDSELSEVIRFRSVSDDHFWEIVARVLIDLMTHEAFSRAGFWSENITDWVMFWPVIRLLSGRICYGIAADGFDGKMID